VTARPRLAAALIVLVAAAVLWPALRVPFFFDDTGDIVGNPEIRQLWPPLWLTAGPPHSNALAGRPASALSFAVGYALWGLDPFGHHAANLVLHLACALLVLGVMRRTLMLPRGGALGDDTATALGAVAALLWALHPLNTEPVAYAVQRTEQLWAVLYLTTLYAAVRALEPASRKTWTAVAFAACALGMGAKETMVSAPLAVAAFDWVFLERDARRGRRGLYAALAATWAGLAVLLASGRQGAVALHASEFLTPWQYLFTQGSVITRYLRLVLWPDPLVIAYDWPQVTPFAEGLPGFLLVGSLLLASAWALARRWPVGFAGACVFLLLAPSSSLVPLPSEIAAERRMYLPSAFVIAILVVLAWNALARVPHRATTSLAAASLTAVALALASRDRLADYRTTLAIWEDAAVKSPHHSTIRSNYGRELVLAGRPAEAVPHLRASIALRADNAVPHYLLGFALFATGDAAAAAPPLREAIRLDPDLSDAHFTLGRALSAAQDWPGAAREYEAVVRLKPDDGESRTELARARNNQASALMREGRVAEALRLLEDAVRVQPGYALGHLNLGNAFAAAGRFDRAVPAWLDAVRAAPRDARVRAMVVDRLRGLPEPGAAALRAAADDGDPAVRGAAADALPRPSRAGAASRE
jgi:tetratricopeptide (TPR) repeat protein